jgi:hypothetical protein
VIIVASPMDDQVGPKPDITFSVGPRGQELEVIPVAVVIEVDGQTPLRKRQPESAFKVDGGSVYDCQLMGRPAK